MDAFTSVLVVKALDGLSARATITAQNIANANSAGYRPMRVSFEKMRATTPRIDYAASPELGASGAMRIDLELTTAAATAGRYGALVELLNRQLQIHSLAVTGGA